VKKIRFLANVPAEVRAIPQPVALGILKALHRYIETGQGRVKPLSGGFEGLLRLRVGDYRVLFDETEDSITVHRVRDRKDAINSVNRRKPKTRYASPRSVAMLLPAGTQPNCFMAYRQVEGRAGQIASDIRARYPKQPFGSHTFAQSARLLASDNAVLCHRHKGPPRLPKLD